MTREKVGVGIIGLGIISRHHVTGFLRSEAHAKIVAVCDVDPAKADKVASDTKATAYTDYHALLANPDVESVDIILPHTLHYQVAMDALNANKHVLMEKPLTVKSSDSLDLIRLAKEKGLKFTVAENTRFTAAYYESENLIRNELGEPRLIRTFISGTEVSRLQDTQLWKGRMDGSGGGAIIDAGAHSFFLLKWLFGEVRDVQVFQEKLVPESQVEDNAVVAGHLKNGGIFTVQVCFTAEAPWNERLEYYGTKGTLVVDQIMNPPAVVYRGRPDTFGTAVANVPFNPTGWKYESIALGAMDFVDAIWENRPPTIDPMDGYYAIKVIEKAYESASLGAPVLV